MQTVEAPADLARIKGHVHLVLLDEFGNVKDERSKSNLVTSVGNQYFAERAANIASPPNQVSGMKLGTGTTAAATTGAGSALVTYITGSQRAMDATFPSAAAGAGTSRRITWQATWAAGVATNAAITEAVIVNEATLADLTTAAANTIARVVFTAISKSATDSLVITWTHDLGT